MKKIISTLFYSHLALPTPFHHPNLPVYSTLTPYPLPTLTFSLPYPQPTLSDGGMTSTVVPTDERIELHDNPLGSRSFDKNDKAK